MVPLGLFYWFIVNISGKQEIFTLNFFYDINFIKNSKELDIVFLNRILLLYHNNLGRYTIIHNLFLGTPTLIEFTLQAFIIQHFFGKKILIFRYKRKKNYKKIKGYKSLYTRIFTNNILLNYEYN